MDKLHAEYRHLANPRQLDRFLDGGGVLVHRDETADSFDYDWHARKLTFEPHFRSHILLHMTKYRSARDLQWAMREDALFEATGVHVEVSVPGFTQANARRPLEPYLVMLRQVMDAVARLPHRRLRRLDKKTWRSIVELLSQVDLFDATQISLPPSLAEWAETTAEKAAVKVQLRMSADGQFKQLLVTSASGNDNPYFETLLDLQEGVGLIYVFDAGYFNIEVYHGIYNSGNHFVTKLHKNIKPVIQRQRPVPDQAVAGGYVVLEDADVCLGDDESRWYRILRVKLTTGKEITILTNLLLLSAEQICLLYRYRWTIEIVFRWLKQLLQLDHFISRDPQGIMRQVLTALIVYGLLVLSNQDPERFSPKQLWRQLQADVHQAIFDFGFQAGLEQGRRETHLQIT
jgi:IS4 transposase